jgi:hypothetical protein
MAALLNPIDKLYLGLESGSRCSAFSLRQRASAITHSLYAMTNPFARDPPPWSPVAATAPC